MEIEKEKIDPIGLPEKTYTFTKRVDAKTSTTIVLTESELTDEYIDVLVSDFAQRWQYLPEKAKRKYLEALNEYQGDPPSDDELSHESDDVIE